MVARKITVRRKANPLIGAKRGEGEWKVMARGNDWWIYHPTRKAIKIGPIDFPRTKNYDKAVAAAEKRNEALKKKRQASRNPKKKSAETGFPVGFKRSLTTLRRRAGKATTLTEAGRIRDAGYKAYDKARAMADRSQWDAMDAAVKEIHRMALASVKEAGQAREAELTAESRRLRQEERKRMREDPAGLWELKVAEARKRSNPRRTTKKNPGRLRALTKI